MKKYLIFTMIVALAFGFSPVFVQASQDSSGSDDSSSGFDDSSSSSGSDSSDRSSESRSSDDSSSGLEVETEHGVTFLKPHGVSGGDVARALGLDSEGMEVETEHGVSFLKPHDSDRSVSLENKLSGRIVLQVQSKGEAWWIDPVTKSRIFLGRPADAFKIMREHALGISNEDLERISRSDESSPSGAIARRLAGRIVLQTEENGEAWYINPVTLKRHFLGRPADAFNVMRGLGLGITDDNLSRVKMLLGKVGERKLVVNLLADNNSGQSGYAEIKEVNGKAKVEIKLFGAPLNSIEPAHIHVGNRPNLGAVKYPLNNVVNGLSETTLSISLDQLLSERPLGINVHKSAAEMNISVSSGNL